MMKCRSVLWSIALGCAFGLMNSAGAAGSALDEDVSTITLRNTTIDARVPPDLRSSVPSAFEPDRHYVLQLDGPMTPSRRVEMSALGLSIADYLGANAFLVGANGVAPAAVAGERVIRFMTAYRDEWKLDPQIGVRDYVTPERAQMSARGMARVTITTFSDMPVDDLVEALRSAGTVQAVSAVGPRHAIDMTLPIADVGALARHAEIQYIEDAPEGTPRNDKTAWIMQSNDSSNGGQTPVWNRGIHGEGQIGGLIDAPMDVNHCCFKDLNPIGPLHRKLVAFHTTPGSNWHGTHTAGTFVGDWGTYGQPDYRDGMALAAKLTFASYYDVFSTPSLFYPYLTTAHNDGARVHSNSWGDDSTTSYTTWCQQADQFMWDNPYDLVLFASTNLTLLKTPENAKNIIAVAGSDTAPNQDYHCRGGQGPTNDGRRKPELFLPGCSVYSASASTLCDWRSGFGTSMACPAVAGAGILVRQYYMNGFYPSGSPRPADEFTPSGALIKATLINCGQDMTGVADYPNNTEGWGRVKLDNTLHFSCDPRRMWVWDVPNASGLSTGGTDVYQVTIADSGTPLRVTLAYTDFPAAINANPAKVNDLDLRVTGPSGSVYLGNVFDVAMGRSTVGGTKDANNNVEQVHLSSPSPGEYTIEVIGYAVSMSTQGYALVATGSVYGGTGDFDADGDADVSDMAHFSGCFTGPGGAYGVGCECTDLDSDGDTDLMDWAVLQNQFGA